MAPGVSSQPTQILLCAWLPNKRTVQFFYDLTGSRVKIINLRNSFLDLFQINHIPASCSISKRLARR